MADEQEYRSACENAAVFDLLPRGKIEVAGKDAAAFLHNLCTNDVKSLALMDVYGRVARMLLELAVERDGVLVIESKPTQQEIASRVGASREMVSRILGDLTVGGYIEVGRDRITIAKTLPRTW